MEAQQSSALHRRPNYAPKPETLALLKVSGNSINGLGERAVRRASPFLWHPPDQHPYGELQVVARQSSWRCPDAAPAIAAGLRELGKHGSLISPQFGAGVRLAGVTIDMPLVPTSPRRFGADEFCSTCQV